MPVRRLDSPLFRWPDADQVSSSVGAWAHLLQERRKDVLAIAIVGSYARGDWGVGSDLDLLIILRESDQPFWDRQLEFDFSDLILPAEALIFSRSEWEQLEKEPNRFFRETIEHAKWVYVQEGFDPNAP